MTNAELDRIESALDLKLPAFYRQYMLDYPLWLVDKQPEWSDVVMGEFANDADRIIEFNQEVREAGPGEFFDDRTWPLHYFVIGSECEQNWYFLDLASGTETVYLFHHEMGEVSPAAESLDKFPDALLDWWANVEDDE